MKQFANIHIGQFSNWSLLVVVLLLIGLWHNSAMAEEKPWHWVAARSGVNTWFVSKGEATVVFDGAKLNAKLVDSKDNSLTFSISGEVKDGKIKAKVTIADSDVGDLRLVGSYDNVKWSNFSSAGRETIILSDKANVIGLTRELTK
jgi:hypothetical protein